MILKNQKGFLFMVWVILIATIGAMAVAPAIHKSFMKSNQPQPEIRHSASDIFSNETFTRKRGGGNN
jgi:hypothetical protein